MTEKTKRKFGPTRGEYQFRLAAGLVILALLAYALFANGMPEGLIVSESILFGSLFGLFLVGHSGLKLIRRDYREV